MFDYYKVKIAPGTKMNHGATSLACNAAGMKAVCSSSPTCFNDNKAGGDCVHTPLETGMEVCGWSMLVDCLLKVLK